MRELIEFKNRTGNEIIRDGDGFKILENNVFRELTGDETVILESIVTELAAVAEKEHKLRSFEDAIQRLLDSVAREHGYDSILSACSYAAFTNPFQTEGEAFVVWRGNVWKYCYDQLALIESGDRAEPTVDEFLAELPAFSLSAQ